MAHKTKHPEAMLRERVSKLVETKRPSPFLHSIRGHQYIDSMLRIMLQEALPRIPAKVLSDMPMTIKVEIAIGLGLLPDSDRPAYAFLNKLRNRFAHNAEAKVTKKDMLDFSSCLSNNLKGIANALNRNRPDTFSSKFTLAFIVYAMFAYLWATLRRRRDDQVVINSAFELMAKRGGVPPLTEDDQRLTDEARKKREAEGRA